MMTIADWIIMGVVHTVNAFMFGYIYKAKEGDKERGFETFLYAMLSLGLYVLLAAALAKG